MYDLVSFLKRPQRVAEPGHVEGGDGMRRLKGRVALVTGVSERGR